MLHWIIICFLFFYSVCWYQRQLTVSLIVIVVISIIIIGIYNFEGVKKKCLCYWTNGLKSATDITSQWIFQIF